MKDIWSKFTSRKFLIAVAGVIMGMVAFFGLDESAVSQISGVVVSILSIASYIFGESKIDTAAVKAFEEVEFVEVNDDD